MTALSMPSTPDPQNGFVIEAKTVEEFLDLLRAMLKRAGLNPKQVSNKTNVLKTKLPRSTAYNWVAAKNKALPKDREQVASFAQACRLNPMEVRRVLWLWDRLSGSPEDTGTELVQVVDAELVTPHNEVRGVPSAVGVAAVASGMPGVQPGVMHGDVIINIRDSNNHHGSGPHDADADRDGTADGGGRGAGRDRRTAGGQEFFSNLLDSRTRLSHALVLLSVFGMFLFGLIAVLSTSRIPAMFMVGAFATLVGVHRFCKR